MIQKHVELIPVKFNLENWILRFIDRDSSGTNASVITYWAELSAGFV